MVIVQIGIPNIKPGMGPKKAWSLIQDRNSLISLLKKDNVARDGFKRNKQLISMNEIPEKIYNLIIEEYQRNTEKINSLEML